MTPTTPIRLLAPDGPPARDRAWATVLAAAVLFLWENFPLYLFGMSKTAGIQLYALIVIAGSGVYALRLLRSRARLTIWDFMPIALIAYCTIVSAYYNTVVVAQPLAGWLPSLYTISTLFFFWFARSMRLSLDQAIEALFWAGAVGSFIVVLNNVSGLDFLDYYTRGSAFGSEHRVVFLKLTASFSFVIGFIRSANARTIRTFAIYAIGLAAIAYNIFVVSESRLAMIAILLASIASIYTVVRLDRRVLISVILPFVLIPAGVYLVNRFIPNVRSIDQLNNYLSHDISASYRQLEIRYFQHYFDTSYGLGFGSMSGSSDFDNIISYSSQFGGEFVGVKGYGMFLDDIGLYSALFQYGYLGLIAIVAMTLMAIVTMIMMLKYKNRYPEVVGVGYVMAGLLISPISLNYFTILYTAHVGGFLWFIASESSIVRQRLTSTIRVNTARRRPVLEKI